MSRLSRFLLVVLIAALAVGCATERMRSKQTVLEDTLRSYAATVRWGDMSQAQAFLDPEVREKRAPSALDLERYRQVQITGYSESPPQPISDSEVRQTVQIDLINIYTQAARSVIDQQLWRYDEAGKRWWLVSGLPDISHSQ